MTTDVTSTCYTSVLTIPAVQALNGTTVLCEDGVSRAVVGNDTVIVASEFNKQLFVIEMHAPQPEVFLFLKRNN